MLDSEKLGAHHISRSATFITISLDDICSGDKGLLYSEGQLPSVDSLDEPTLDNVAYRHLEGPWYLFVDRVDCTIFGPFGLQAVSTR